MTPLQTNELQAAKEAVEAFANEKGFSWALVAEAPLIEGICIAIVNAVDKVRASQSVQRD